MGFVPEHVNPILLALVAMATAALLDRRRWWLVGVPALLGLTIGFVVDVTGASVHDIPLVPFLVEVTTIATLGGLAFGRRSEQTL